MQVRKIFENYYDNKMELIFVENELKSLHEIYAPSITSNLSLTPKRKSGIGSSTEQAVIKISEERALLDQRRLRIVNDIDLVEQLTNLLMDDQKEILDLRIRRKMTWMTIGEKLMIDERTAKRRYEEVFKQLDNIYKRIKI